MYGSLINQDKKIKKHLNLIGLHEENCESIIQNIREALIKESNMPLQDRRMNSELPFLLDILTKMKLSLFNEYNELFLAIEKYDLILSKGMQKMGFVVIKENYNSEDYDEFLKKLKKRTFPYFNSYKDMPIRKEFNEKGRDVKW